MLISHPAEANVKAKPLVEHLGNVAETAAQNLAALHLEPTITTRENLSRLARLIGIFHDFGKATTFFQAYIRRGHGRGDRFTRHSFLSAAAAYFFVSQELDSELLALIAFQVIRRHHGHLESFDSPPEQAIGPMLATAEVQLKNIMAHHFRELAPFYAGYLKSTDLFHRLDLTEIPEAVADWYDMADHHLGDHQEKRIELFFTVNLLFSLLVDGDKKDAARLDTRYYQGNLEEPFCDVTAYIDSLRRLDPARYGEQVPINRLRSRFIQEIAANREICGRRRFYTITAPTGIGKTLGCLAFAANLIRSLNRPNMRVIYCLPYTSIIDQNFAVFEEVMRFHLGQAYEQRPGRYLLKHHHLEPKLVENRVSREEYRYKDYLNDTLLVESWEAAFVVTTFVQLFHSLLGYQNRLLKKFHHIVNSLVILDEVQNIDPNYYLLLRRALAVLGERFHTYFLLVTATQPEILDRDRGHPCPVVEASHYLAHPLFNRVRLSVHRQPQTVAQFRQAFCREFSGKNCLLVLNTRGSALSLYHGLRAAMPGYRFYSLTTLLVPRDRRRRIEEIRQALDRGEPLIVVSTQLVEAGVDLSFQAVYRDFGPLDSIIQAAGRCNRHGEYGPGGGEVTLVRLSDEDHRFREFHSYIYPPIIAQYVDTALTRDTYESTDFGGLAKDYFRRFDFGRTSTDLIGALCDLRYDDSGRGKASVADFKLIQAYEEETVFILTTAGAQGQMERLRALLDELADGELTAGEKDTLMLEMERLKAELRAYQLSLRSKDLAVYLDTPLLEECGVYRYISYENQERYAYDEDTGFLAEPKQAVSGAVCF
jgi:CRISPR-associated endonuclease/helicase Cas3